MFVAFAVCSVRAVRAGRVRAAGRALARGSHRIGQPHDPARCPGDHAGHRRSDPDGDSGGSLVVPRLEPACASLADLDLFGAHRAHHLVDSRARGFLSRRDRLDRVSLARSCSPARLEHQAARNPGGLARLEVVVHLPRAGGGIGERGGGPGGGSAAFSTHLRERLQRVLRAPARERDLLDVRHGHAAQPAGRSSRHL